MAAELGRPVGLVQFLAGTAHEIVGVFHSIIHIECMHPLMVLV
nr:hypothetical protein Iba_chr07cCG2210 [Ipomoea batatas]